MSEDHAPTCFYCDGLGKFRAYRVGPDGKHEFVYSVDCCKCEGTGKEPAAPESAAA